VGERQVGGRRRKNRQASSITDLLDFRGCTSLLAFSVSDFVFSSIGAANIHRIIWANVKRVGDNGHQLKGYARRRALEHYHSVPFFPQPP
jgi:hypothetical protein